MSSKKLKEIMRISAASNLGAFCIPSLRAAQNDNQLTHDLKRSLGGGTWVEWAESMTSSKKHSID
ncbi:MAG: hypothetical protein VYA34_13710 [Myxococcota bacterium]|nr:hypothetical protein [Myxococcota bacterium]